MTATRPRQRVNRGGDKRNDENRRRTENGHEIERNEDGDNTETEPRLTSQESPNPDHAEIAKIETTTKPRRRRETESNETEAATKPRRRRWRDGGNQNNPKFTRRRERDIVPCTGTARISSSVIASFSLMCVAQCCEKSSTDFPFFSNFINFDFTCHRVGHLQARMNQVWESASETQN